MSTGAKLVSLLLLSSVSGRWIHGLLSCAALCFSRMWLSGANVVSGGVKRKARRAAISASHTNVCQRLLGMR